MDKDYANKTHDRIVTLDSSYHELFHEGNYNIGDIICVEYQSTDFFIIFHAKELHSKKNISNTLDNLMITKDDKLCGFIDGYAHDIKWYCMYKI